MSTPARRCLVSLALGAALAGCGSNGSGTTNASSSSAEPSTAASVPGTATTRPASSASAAPVGALTTEAAAAAAGDIPDNQVFLTFANALAGYTLRYPEGWAQRGTGSDVTFADKSNVVHIVVRRGAAPTAAGVRAELAALAAVTPSLRPQAPRSVTLGGAPAIHVVYRTQSEPSAVTGKRVTLTVDRYELAHAGKVAVVDLGTPQGVDNVDAYRLMITSFRWR